ncbi:AAA family ATPase [Streptomyces yangpuensis]
MLVEREEHLGRLHQIQESALAGKGRVVLLEGPTAAGRTELLHAFADQAEAAGFRLVHAVCSRSEQNLAFGMLNQLLRYAGLPMTTDTRETGPGPSGPDGPSVRAWSADELCASLLEQAADRPLLLAVDDSQYADADSLSVLLRHSRRLRSARVVVVLADSDVPSSNLPLRAELLRQPNLSRVRVSLLTRSGVREFLTGRLGADEAARLACDFHALTGGSPLLLGALADDHADPDGPLAARGYGLALLSCLHRGDPAVLALARALAVLDEDATEDGLASLAGGIDVRAVSRAMTAAGLLDDDGGFRHPAARQAVLEDLAPREHSALYGRAARLLHAAGAEPVRVARHLREAGRADGPWAVRALVEAAEYEVLADRPEDAAACLELAERSSGDLTERAEVLARLAHTGFQFDPATASRHLAPLVTAGRAGHLKFRESALLVRQLLWNGRAEEASSVLDRMRESADEPTADPGSELADLEQWLAWAHPPLARPVGTSGAASRRPGATGESAGTVVALRSEPWLGRAATLANHLARDRPGAAERAEQVLWDLRLSRTECWTGESAMLALLTLLHSDRADLAADWCERLSADAANHSAPTWQAVFTAIRAEVAVRQGDLESAVEKAQEAFALLPPKSWGVAIGLPLSSLIVATTRIGRHEEAARWLSYAVPTAMYESWYGLSFLQARGIHHLATNHVHAALGDFLSCGELQRNWGMDSPGPVAWRAGAAEACIRLGNPDRAKQLVHEQLARPAGAGSRIRGMSLRLYAATCAPGRALQLLTEALELLESAGDRFEQARVLADMSRMYYALGEHRRARMMFRQSLHVAKACEAHPLAQELLSGSGEYERPRIAAAEAPSAGHGELTGSERRVASLAVMGYTNREIASKLYVTPSTVEQHLTRVYRKLKIQRRQDLPSDLWPNASRAG